MKRFGNEVTPTGSRCALGPNVVLGVSVMFELVAGLPGGESNAATGPATTFIVIAGIDVAFAPKLTTLLNTSRTAIADPPMLFPAGGTLLAIAFPASASRGSRAPVVIASFVVTPVVSARSTVTFGMNVRWSCIAGC